MSTADPKAPIRVLAWSENTEPRECYPNGTHGAIADFLKSEPDLQVATAQITDPDQGLSENVLADTDVLIWWGHKHHKDVTDETVARVVRHITERGMGFLPIHSAHHSKPFKALHSTSCDLGSWKEDGAPESLQVVDTTHPIAVGVSDFVLPQTEHYGEPFDVPEPLTVVLRSTWEDGTWFRSGCVWKSGNGTIFYFRPGHETYPIMADANVQKIIKNGVRFLAAR